MFNDIEIVRLIGKYSNAIDAYSAFLKKLNMPKNIYELTKDLEVNMHFIDIANSCSKTTLSGTIGNYCRLDVQDIKELLHITEN